MEKVLYEELRPREFAERIAKAPIAYLPLGTLEWHGLHLPLGSDGLQSRGLFCEMARRLGGVVLPMLFVAPDRTAEIDGKTYYGMDFCYRPDGQPARQLEGSAYHVPDDFYDQLLDHIMAQLKRAGFKVVIGHGHGPSNRAFRKIIPVMKEKYGLHLINACFEDTQRGFQSDHAAANETSIMMHFHPELVDLNELDPDPAIFPEAVAGDDPRVYATAEEGRLATEETIQRLTQEVCKYLEV
ncbi:MAG: creatininase family protein [Clostridia bacterium]|nr:creatininase family protein [Clostridia bacterium]